MEKKDDFLTVIVFNVGQGDNILIQFPDNEYGIIDFYYDIEINPKAEPPALTYLKKLNKEDIKIKFLHLSHYHLDHFKGFLNVISWIDNENISLDKIYFPSFPHHASVFERMFDFVRSKFVNNEELLDEIEKELAPISKYFQRFNQIISIFKWTENSLENYESIFRPLFGPSPVITDALNKNEIFCISPIPERVTKYISKTILEIFWRFAATNLEKEKMIQEKLEAMEKDNADNLGEKENIYIDQNELSVILKMTFNEKCLIFTGDASTGIILESFNRYKETNSAVSCLNGNLIKAPHHGSKYSSSLDTWNILLPSDSDSIIVISAGNGYNHPHEKTLNHIDSVSELKNNKKKVFSTNHKSGITKKHINWHEKTANQNNLTGPLKKSKIIDDFIGYEFIIKNADIDIASLYSKPLEIE